VVLNPSGTRSCKEAQARKARWLRAWLTLPVVAIGVSGCALTFPMMGLKSSNEPEPVVVTTGALQQGPRRDAPHLSDHLGPEDMRRALGAMALALDPQGNGSPVNWDNAESKASGRFTPVSGPYLKDDEICRAFLAAIRTPMDQHALQGTACRPSGGAWDIRELKPWKPAG
jgi:surface antigen